MAKGGRREGAGRKAGSTGATNKLLKDAIIAAAEAVGADGEGADGMIGYLTQRAKDQPVAFMGLLGKVIPLTLQGDPDKPLHVQHDIKPADRLRDMVVQIAERSREAGVAVTH